MDEVFDDIVSPADLKKFEQIYNAQLRNECVEKDTQFNYAYCLVRSKYPTDIRKGIVLLEELYKNNPDGRRDYLYYLAFGNTRIREYNEALRFCRNFLQIEPNNPQVQQLEKTVQEKLHNEGRRGMALAGGAGVFVLGALVAVGMALTKK